MKVSMNFQLRVCILEHICSNTQALRILCCNNVCILPTTCIYSSIFLLTFTDCSNLTFDVAAIEEREFIFKAEVYLEITYSVDVEIELWLTENIRVPPTVLNRPSTMTTSSETVVFQIGKYLVDLVDSDNFTGSLHFSLITWKIDANNQVKLTCNIPNGVLEIKRGDPSLVVYSYDTKEELLETIQKKLLDSSTSTTLPPSVRLNKRESSDHPCTRLSLDVDKKVLNDIMEGTHRTIALPDVFDTGVCAGSCLGSLAQETLHSSILHLLLSSTPNEPAKINDTTVYQKCCAPVEYSAMSMITLLQKPNHPPVYEIKVFHDLSVKRCACIYSRI